MFQRFIHMQRPSARQIAKEFKRARGTVQSVRRKYKWDQRKAAILDEEQRQLDVQRAKDDVSNMQLVTAIKNGDTANDEETLTGGGRRPVLRPRSTGAAFAILPRNNTADERFALERTTVRITDAGKVKGA